MDAISEIAGQGIRKQASNRTLNRAGAKNVKNMDVAQSNVAWVCFPVCLLEYRRDKTWQLFWFLVVFFFVV